MFKHLRSILSIGAIMVGAACYAEVTEVYSIDFTQKETYPFGTDAAITMSTTDGLVYTGGIQFHIAEQVPVKEKEFYTITINAKASKPVSFNVYFANWGTDCGGRISLTEEWQEISFVAQSLNNGTYFMSAQPFGFDGTLYIKSVTVTTGDIDLDPELLCLKATNVEKKANSWDNMINYNFNTPLAPGKYNLAFDLNGTDNGTISLWAALALKTDLNGDFLRSQWGGISPTNGWYGPQFNVVKDTWKHYEVEVTFPETGTREIDGVNTTVYTFLNTLQFAFGTSYAGDLFIDNIVMKAAGEDENLIPNNDFVIYNKGNWSSNGSFTLEIANGPEHPAVTRTADANSIWFDINGFESDWGKAVFIKPSEFANVQPGDIIRLVYENHGGYTAPMFGDWGHNFGVAGYQQDNYAFYSDNFTDLAVIEFTDAMYDIVKKEEIDGVQTDVHYNLYDLLKQYGMTVRGPGATFYDVIYIPVNKIAYVDAENSISFLTNYAGKEGENWVANNLKIKDAAKYWAENDLTAKNLTYTRTFGSDNWQALYVPYDMDASEWAELGTVAELTDATKVGTEVTLTWETVESGKLTPNTPYIFKPAAAGAVEFTGENKNVKAATSATVSAGCATLTGIYVEKVDMADEGAYALSGGTFYRTNDNAKTLKPFRIYLTIAGNAGAKVRNIVNGEVTGIEDIITEIPADGTYYDIMGRKIENPVKGGIYIKGGKKAIIR